MNTSITTEIISEILSIRKGNGIFNEDIFNTDSKIFALQKRMEYPLIVDGESLEKLWDDSKNGGIYAIINERAEYIRFNQIYWIKEKKG